MIILLLNYNVNAFEVHICSKHFGSRSLCRSIRPEVFLRRGVLKICSKFTGEHPSQMIFPNNTSGWLLLMYGPILANVHKHCVKSILIWSYSGPHFPTFGMNTVRYCIQSECGKMRTRITPNLDTSYAVKTAYSNKYQIFAFSKNKLVIKTFSRNTIE